MPRKTRARDNAQMIRTGASMRPRPDAAENDDMARRHDAGAPRFNEAAARCRGKLCPDEMERLREVASMRPRPDAAENVRKRKLEARSTSASMRPRPDAAENCRSTPSRPSTCDASMRPRPDAAENRPAVARRGGARHRFNEAAARCRGKLWHVRPDGYEDFCFNEAAARCRGKRAGGNRPLRIDADASMRPRPDAAENVGTRGLGVRGRTGFNEAAARCRGKPLVERVAERVLHVLQ